MTLVVSKSNQIVFLLYKLKIVVLVNFSSSIPEGRLVTKSELQTGSLGFQCSAHPIKHATLCP